MPASKLANATTNTHNHTHTHTHTAHSTHNHKENQRTLNVKAGLVALPVGIVGTDHGEVVGHGHTEVVGEGSQIALGGVLSNELGHGLSDSGRRHTQRIGVERGKHTRSDKVAGDHRHVVEGVWQRGGTQAGEGRGERDGVLTVDRERSGGGQATGERVLGRLTVEREISARLVGVGERWHTLVEHSQLHRGQVTGRRHRTGYTAVAAEQCYVHVQCVLRVGRDVCVCVYEVCIRVCVCVCVCV
jgi:hypothetical protein